MPKANSDAFNDKTLPSCLLSQNIVNAGSRGYGMGHRGCHGYIYLAFAKFREFRKNETIVHINAVSYFNHNCKYSFLKTLDCGIKKLLKIFLFRSKNISVINYKAQR